MSNYEYEEENFQLKEDESKEDDITPISYKTFGELIIKVKELEAEVRRLSSSVGQTKVYPIQQSDDVIIASYQTENL